MQREKRIEQPIWNLRTDQCGPDISCTDFTNGVCHFDGLGRNKGKLICPNPECKKRKIVGYEEIYPQKKQKIAYYESLLSGRAGKLLKEGKFFLVVAEDEPYFKKVYEMIRDHEIEIGRWTEEDQEMFEGKPIVDSLDL